jgi:predicted dehydrogenase
VSQLRLAIIGAGHLGRIHAKLAKTIDGVDVVGVTDPFEAARAAVQTQLGLPTFASHRDLIDRIDAAVVATPTESHFEVVQQLLAAGKHVLCEKPLTIDAAESQQLAYEAKRRRCVLQVGHIERFNPVWIAAQGTTRDARYIEATRASAFPGRCLDVGVVLDLMIHDLDLVLSLAGTLPERVDASGMAVVSDHEDIAEARLTFASGLVANLKASRVSPTAVRQLHSYGPAGYAMLDFSAPTLQVIEPHPSILDRSFSLADQGPPGAFRESLFANYLVPRSVPIEPRNAILDELHDFAISIRAGSAPIVDGAAGARAVAVASQILEAIDRRRWDRTGLQRGPHATPPHGSQHGSQRAAA